MLIVDRKINSADNNAFKSYQLKKSSNRSIKLFS